MDPIILVSNNILLFLPFLDVLSGNLYLLKSYQLKKVSKFVRHFIFLHDINQCIFDNLCLHFFLAGKTLLELVIEQFEDLLVRILLLAACISFVSILYFLFHICLTCHVYKPAMQILQKFLN